MNKSYLWILALCCLGCTSRLSKVQHPDAPDEATSVQLYERGVLLGRAGDYLRAAQYLEAAIERGYALDEATAALVRVCVLGSQLRTALRHAEPQLLRDPDDASLRYLVATLHFGLDHPVQARDELTRLTKLSPEHADAHYLLGVLARDVFFTRNEVRSHFRRYLELKPAGAHAGEAVAWLSQAAEIDAPHKRRSDRQKVTP